uniref:Uncharacterized protein n=1 Tax=Fusarium oxysporum (strain Fo5176) TaxID=660025 RepID=A0A0D2XZQ0_FUSOF
MQREHRENGWDVMVGWQLVAGCWLGRVQCGRSPSWRWIELGLVAQVLSSCVLRRSNNGHARLSEYRTVASYRTVKRDEGAGGWIGPTVEAQAKARGLDMGSQVKQNKIR